MKTSAGSDWSVASQRAYYFALWTILFALCPAEAQHRTKTPRLGFIIGASASAASPRIEAFRNGLREYGYEEGKNIVIEYRYAEGKLDRLSTLAAELVKLNVDIILSSGAITTHAAKNATNTIPIIMAQDNDPIGNGFIASLVRPGGNITGLTTLGAEISGKQLELLKEVIPKLSRLAVLGTSSNPGTAQALSETELAARFYGVQLKFLDILQPKDIETVFHDATKGRADAVLVLVSAVLNSNRRQIIESTLKSRFPTMCYTAEWVEDGGLMNYGVSFTDSYRRAATYVDKILKGANPAELPVEQPKKFDLVINLKAAK